MPIYEYRCKNCQHDFEALVWSGAEEQSLCCPRCRCREVDRMLSLFSTSCSSAARPSKSSCAPKTGGFS